MPSIETIAMSLPGLTPAAFAASFLYFALRAVFFDVFAWIIVVPIMAGMYILTVIPRYSRIRLNALDRRHDEHNAANDS